MLEQRPFRRLDETGFTLAELSALYFSRTLVEALAATPFQQDVRSAFDKLAAVLTPGMKQFLDRLPLVLQAKAEPGAPAPAAPRSPRRARATGRGDAASPAHRNALPLDVEQSRKGLPDRAVPAGVRAGRPVRGGVRAGVQGSCAPSPSIASSGFRSPRNGSSHPMRRRKCSRTRSACTRARPSPSKSLSSRASPATSRNGCGTPRSRPRINLTAAFTSRCRCRTTGPCGAGSWDSARWPG